MNTKRSEITTTLYLPQTYLTELAKYGVTPEAIVKGFEDDINKAVEKRLHELQIVAKLDGLPEPYAKVHVLHCILHLPTFARFPPKQIFEAFDKTLGAET